MRYCCVKTCRNKADNVKFSLFNFPNTPERRHVWVKRLRLDVKDLKKSSRVCSAHFSRTQINSVCLKKKALPLRVTVDTGNGEMCGISLQGNRVEHPKPSDNTQSYSSTHPTALTGKSQVFDSANKLEEENGIPLEGNQGGYPADHLSTIVRRNALCEMDMNSDRRLLHKLKPRELFPASQIESTTETFSPTQSGILREMKDVGYPGESTATDLMITPLSNVSEEDINITNSVNGQSENDSRNRFDALKKQNYIKIIANQRKRLKRLLEKTNEIKEFKIWKKQAAACRKESPMFYDWIVKQLQRFGNEGSPQYDIQERAVALTIYYTCGERGYETQRRMGFKLPCVSQIRRWMQLIEFKPGINTDVMELLKSYCDSLLIEDRNCIITWDEMSIKQLIEYDKNADKLEGIQELAHSSRLSPATEALVVMISGIRKSWSFPIAFYFSSGPTKPADLKTIVESNISSIKTIGFKVRLGVCDMSGSNRGLYKLWAVDELQPYAIICQEKVYMVHDTPHLIKLVRNNLINKTYQFKSMTDSETKVARWTHIKDFYAKDSERLARMAPKISKLHMEVKNYSKMKVKLAVQLLSHSVAAGMRTFVALKSMPEDVLETADFIQTVDELFDLLNISAQFDKKQVKSAAFLMSNLQLLEDYKSFIKSIKWESHCKPHCFRGLTVTLSGVKLLLQDLINENFLFVCTRKLQQDCLENLFCVIRQAGGWNKNPTAREFRNRFKICFIKSFVSKSRVSNCQETDTDDMDFKFHLVKSLFITKLPSVTNDTCPTETSNKCIMNDLSEVDFQGNVKSCSSFFLRRSGDLNHSVELYNIAVYVGGFCVKKVLQKVRCEESCSLLLSETISENNNSHILAFKKAFNSVLKPCAKKERVTYDDAIDIRTTAVFAFIMHMFSHTVNNILSKKSSAILEGVFDIFQNNQAIKLWFDDGSCGHRQLMVKLLLRVLMYQLVRDKNSEFKKPKSWSQKRIDLRSQ